MRSILEPVDLRLRAAVVPATSKGLAAKYRGGSEVSEV